MKTLLTVGYGCNNHCTFCHSLDRRAVTATDDAVSHWIHRAATLGHHTVVLTGGEPTIHPWFTRWTARIAARGMGLELFTNGRMLAYPGVIHRLRAHGLRAVTVSLHGATAARHDAITRSTAFTQTVAALRQLSSLGVPVTVHTVLTVDSVDTLDALHRTVQRLPGVRLRLSLARWAPSHTTTHPVVPDLARAVRAVQPILHRDPTVTHDGFPLCLLPDAVHRHDDLQDQGITHVGTPGTDDLTPLDTWETHRVHPLVCNPCALRGRCPGLDRGSPTVATEGALLAPMDTVPRANSYNYTLRGTLPGSLGDTYTACPVWTHGPSPWDRGRDLFLREDTRVGRYRADTRDFATPEIHHVTHTLGQVYLDASDKPAPDDFTRDLVQLRRSAVCTPCPAHATCPGVWERSAVHDPFTRDDARVRAVLEHLTGDVLDVGCGEGPYEDILAARVRAGAIRYTGIDPDPARVASLQSRWPWATVSVGTAETLARDLRVDHVLVLRSWNHIRDPVTAVDAMVHVLRPGGSLTVVDNTAFGLVRTRVQTARAEHGTAVLEHYRTDTARDAHTVFSRTALVLVSRQEVGPETSNQWLLQYRKP